MIHPLSTAECPHGNLCARIDSALFHGPTCGAVHPSVTLQPPSSWPQRTGGVADGPASTAGAKTQGALIDGISMESVRWSFGSGSQEGKEVNVLAGCHGTWFPNLVVLPDGLLDCYGNILCSGHYFSLAEHLNLSEFAVQPSRHWWTYHLPQRTDPTTTKPLLWGNSPLATHDSVSIRPCHP